MSGSFSVPPLERLLTVGIEVAAVIIPATLPASELLPRRLVPPPPVFADLPIINPYLDQNIVHLAWAHQIPVWEVGKLSERLTMETLAAFQPDLIIVACFSRLFPPSLLELPRYGCLNLHPSLLPAYRGPAPLFWLARQGEGQAGVTLHFLDEDLDTGDIVAQIALAWPDGLSERELEQRCAAAGAELVLKAVQQLAQDRALSRQAQPAAGSSYFPWPSEQDFVIPTRWTARRAFNFLRAAGSWPLVIEVGSERFYIRIAIDYKLEQQLGRPFIIQKDELWVQFQPGVLRVGI